ncbi:MAG: thioredoxin [Ilumatobacteraceae bacterium]
MNQVVSVIDVSDATFQRDVLERSKTTPVIVDLWATWCGPCKTLGPILEKVVKATNGKVVLAKVDVDRNPGIAQAFQVQSIPMVVAMKNGQPVDAFMGAQPEHAVREFVGKLVPEGEVLDVAALLARGDEASLREALKMEPQNEQVVLALAALLLSRNDVTGALEILQRVPQSPKIAALVEKAKAMFVPEDNYATQLDALLPLVKADEEARKRFLEILETMGPGDPRTSVYRRRMTGMLYA